MGVPLSQHVYYRMAIRASFCKMIILFNNKSSVLWWCYSPPNKAYHLFVSICWQVLHIRDLIVYPLSLLYFHRVISSSPNLGCRHQLGPSNRLLPSHIAPSISGSTPIHLVPSYPSSGYSRHVPLKLNRT